MSPSSCQGAWDLQTYWVHCDLNLSHNSTYYLIYVFKKFDKRPSLFISVVSGHQVFFIPPLHKSNNILVCCPSISSPRTPRWINHAKDYLGHSDYHFFSSGKYGKYAHLAWGGLNAVTYPHPHWWLPSGISLWHLHHYTWPTENSHRETFKDAGASSLIYASMPSWTECLPDLEGM